MILRLIVNVIAIMLAAYLVPGVTVGGWGTAILLALVLGILNVLVKPVLVILTLPVSFLTLGLFVLIINVLILFLAAALVPGFELASFWAALIFGLVMGLIQSVLHALTA